MTVDAVQMWVRPPGSTRLLGYLARIPDPEEVPDRHVVVHNHVQPARDLGMNGFRAWIEEPSEKLVACSCPWAPRLGTHYRVNRSSS
jgi:hypothetical protein